MYQHILQNAPLGFVSPHELTNTPPGTPVLVGFSGGADSMLLLTLMVAYGKQYGTPVYAAHFHHGIRGKEADRDRDFCVEVAKNLGVPLFEGSADIPALATAFGRSLELQARLTRYEFFENIMAEHDIPLLLTAHHADDQLETLLLRFLRGSGTRGMGGIHPVRPLGQGLVARPLLSCTKADILSCCETLGLSYVTDSTNEDDDATRNRLRHHLIPLMTSLSDHGTPTASALRLSAHAREDEDFIMTCVRDVMSQSVRNNRIALDTLKKLHSAVGKRVLGEMFSLALSQATLPADGKHTLSALHLDTLWDFCHTAKSGQSLHLPGQMQALVTGGDLCFAPQIRPLADNDSDSDNTPIPLSLGVLDWDNGRIGIGVSMGEHPPIPSQDIIASATFPLSVFPLSVRRREKGDVIYSHGMHKKLKKLLCDKGIPLELRDTLPLICYGEDCTPLWYPLVAFADGFPPPENDTEAHASVTITIFEQNPRKGTNI